MINCGIGIKLNIKGRSVLNYCSSSPNQAENTTMMVLLETIFVKLIFMHLLLFEVLIKLYATLKAHTFRKLANIAQ